MGQKKREFVGGRYSLLCCYKLCPCFYSNACGRKKELLSELRATLKDGDGTPTTITAPRLCTLVFVLLFVVTLCTKEQGELSTRFFERDELFLSSQLNSYMHCSRYNRILFSYQKIAFTSR